MKNPTIKKDKRGTIWLSANGKRCSVRVIGGPWIEGVNPEQIKIRPSKAYAFPQEIKESLITTNNSDMMTDYFEKDTITLLPEHPLHAIAKEVL
jgi:hypothetical protein